MQTPFSYLDLIAYAASGRCPVSRQTMVEESLNMLTHRFAFLFSCVGLVLMVTLAAIHGTVLHVVVTALFCIFLVLLFLVSMLYHSAHEVSRKRVLQMLDHMVIYLVIAGTYTPFMLVIHHDPVALPVFWLMWAVAAAGILFKRYYTGRFRLLSTLGYLGMGWMMVLSFPALYANLPGPGFLLLAGGGLAYTVGTVFFLWNGLPFNHALWHLAVMTGAGCHYFAVLSLVIV